MIKKIIGFFKDLIQQILANTQIAKNKRLQEEIENIYDRVEDESQIDSRKEAHKTTIAIDLLKPLILGDSTARLPDEPHPAHDERVSDYIKQIPMLPAGTPIAVSVGDSLIDLTREYMTSIDYILNISGAWSYHCEQMIKTMAPVMRANYIKVGTYVGGTYAGNPQLLLENYDKSKRDALHTHDVARNAWPDARAILIGFPPVWSLHASVNSWDFDQSLLEWAVKDGNAAVISLKKLGTGFLNLKPTYENSLEGIHLGAQAARRLNRAIEKAKTSVSGALIFA